MEHLKELLLEGSNPLKDAAMFGLVFDNVPTYEDLKNGTPDLAPVFVLNDHYQSSKSLTVSHTGLEPFDPITTVFGVYHFKARRDKGDTIKKECLKDNDVVGYSLSVTSENEYNILITMLYAFALTSGLGRLLYKLKSPDHCYIVYSNNFDHYLDLLVHDQPSHILGLGSYSGIDQNKIRIERITTNQFRNDKIEENTPDKIEINNFIQLPMPNVHFKYADAVGNSWCNLISWKIMRLIENGILRSRYAFLHIPKGFDQKLAVDVIDQALLEQ